MAKLYNRFKYALNKILQKTESSMLYLDTIGKASFTILKIIIIFILIYFMIYLAIWLPNKEEGIIIQPFETVGFEGNISGKAVADLLRCELQRIKEIYEPGQKETLNLQMGEGFILPPIVFNNEPLEHSITEMGTIGVEGTSISVGHILLSMKELSGNRVSSLTGSIQRYGSTISIVTILEDRHSSERGMAAWEVRRNLTGINRPMNEQIPAEISNLALQITHGMIKRWSHSKDYPRSWQAFRHFTQGRDAYLSYVITKNISDLNTSRDLIQLVRHSEPEYNGSYLFLYNLGFAYLNRGLKNESKNIFQDISYQMPFKSTLGLGIVYLNEGDNEKALNAFEKATILDPKSGSAWGGKGLALYKLDMYNESIRAYDEAIRLDPNDASSWNNKGLVLNSQGKYDEAVKAIDEAIKLDPNDASSWNNKGLVLNNLGKYNESIKAIDEAIKLDPNFALAWFNKALATDDLAWNNNNASKYYESIRAYDEAIRLDPNNAVAWYYKATLAFQISNLPSTMISSDFKIKMRNESLKAYNESIRIDPKVMEKPSVYGTFGTSFKYQGRSAVAAYYTKSLK